MRMPPSGSPKAQAEHPLQSGFALYVMRRQKHSRAAAKLKMQQSKEQTGEDGAPIAPDAPSAAQEKTAAAPDVDDYEKLLKKIASFSTVEQFWRVYSHMARPSDIPALTDVHVFRDSIKPVWEDPSNRRGGRVVVKLRKGIASRYWESLLLAMIGEQFGELNSEVCGLVISVRHNEDVLSLWTRTSDNAEVVHKIKDMMRKILKVPGFVQIDYKRHETATVSSSLSSNPAQQQSQQQQPNQTVQTEDRSGGARPPAWRNTAPSAARPIAQVPAGDWRS